MDKRFLTIIAVLVVGFAGILFFSNKSDDTSSSSDKGQVAAATNHVFGEGQKGVTLIEYGDFQCPACAQYFPIIKALKEQYKNDIKLQFRHFPLTSIHVNAFAASRAAEAASKQNKFWEMHDALYENQQEWAQAPNPKTIFESYAKALGLNMQQFQTDYSSDAVNDAINADLAEGEKAGASSTPTFVLNGKKIEDNPRGLEEFAKLIDEAIAKKNSSVTP